MSIEVLDDGRIILRASGEIDLSNAGELRQAIEQVLAQSPEGFVIDLSDVSYIDSAGIAAIMSAYQRICPAGRLVVVVVNENVKSILRLIHIERLPGLYVLDDITAAEQVLVRC